jgi:hypothetical protein
MGSEEFGTVVEVSTVNAGSLFSADEATGQTVLSLVDVTVFGELGGQVYIDGETYDYTAVDQAANTMTLLSGLVADATTETRAEIWPPAPVRSALVAFGVTEGEAVRVIIPATLSLPDGVRPELDREVVLVEERNPGELYVRDIMAQGMTILGPGMDLDDQTSPGNFIQFSSAEAAAGTNYPVPYAGALEVVATRPEKIMVQRYTAWRTAADTNYPSAWVRAFGDDAWSPWKPLNVEPHHFTAVASTTISPTTTATLIPGLTIDITPASPDAVYLVIGSVDYSATSSAAAIAFTSLYIDSTAQNSDITFSSPGQVSRGTGSQTWPISGLSVATHTFQLRVAGTSGVTGYTVHTNSRLSIVRLNY